MSVISAQMASRFASIRSPEDEEKGTVIRKPTSALLTIDSSDRYSSVVASRSGTTSPYSFSISKSENILTGFVKRISLTEIVFPWYIPNINFRTRELFYLSSIVGNGSITLNTGFYTPTALAAAVQAALIADGVLGVSVIFINGQFVVDAGAGNTIAFFAASSVPPGSKLEEFQLFDLMGFSSSNNVPAQFQFSQVTRCRYTEYIDIVCSQLIYNQDLKDQSSSPIVRESLARVYLECENDQPIPVSIGGTSTDPDNTIPGCYPFTIYRQFKSPKEIKWNSAQPVGNLTFEVYDDNGQLLSGFGLQDYAFPDWRMTLLCSEN